MFYAAGTVAFAPLLGDAFAAFLAGAFAVLLVVLAVFCAAG
jgi:hypothetical protein